MGAAGVARFCVPGFLPMRHCVARHKRRGAYGGGSGAFRRAVWQAAQSDARRAEPRFTGQVGAAPRREGGDANSGAPVSAAGRGLHRDGGTACAGGTRALQAGVVCGSGPLPGGCRAGSGRSDASGAVGAAVPRAPTHRGAWRRWRAEDLSLVFRPRPDAIEHVPLCAGFATGSGGAGRGGRFSAGNAGAGRLVVVSACAGADAVEIGVGSIDCDSPGGILPAVGGAGRRTVSRAYDQARAGALIRDRRLADGNIAEAEKMMGFLRGDSPA